MKSPLFLTLLLICSIPSFAQKKMRVKQSFGRTHTEGGVTFSSDFSNSIYAASALQYWSFGEENRKFKFGLGARYNFSAGDKSLEYITARAKLTSGKVGPSVFFADQIAENIDTLGLSSTRIHALNLMLALRYDLDKKFGVEFNIDLAGISFGSRQTATLQYNDGKKLTTNAYPTTGNLLLVSDNDIGNLNSELMLSYLHKKNLRFKIGGVFMFNEYTITNEPTYVNNQGTVIDAERFRNKTLQLGIGFNYVFNYFLNKNFKN